MLGKAGHDVAVVHPPAVLALEVLADVPSAERGGRTEIVVAGRIVIDVMDAEEKRVVRLPPLAERIDAGKVLLRKCLVDHDDGGSSRPVRIGEVAAAQEGDTKRLEVPGRHLPVDDVHPVLIRLAPLHREVAGPADRGERQLTDGTHFGHLRKLPDLRISDFGMRRRHSFLWQDWAVQAMIEGLGDRFLGTSNCLIAMRRDLEAIGTNAHELPMVYAALADDDEGLAEAPYRVLENWHADYDGNLRIVGLARRDQQAKWPALGIGVDMELGREATARTAKALAISPPFPPAAQWCARMVVLSIICKAAASGSASANASRITSHMPDTVQRRNWR